MIYYGTTIYYNMLSYTYYKPPVVTNRTAVLRSAEACYDPQVCVFQGFSAVALSVLATRGNNSFGHLDAS